MKFIIAIVNTKAWLFICLIFCLLMQSCFKDIDTEKMPSQQTITAGYNIQETQYFYKIDDNGIRFVKVIAPESWDLLFENGDSGWQIKLNYSTGAKIINTGFSTMDQISPEMVSDLKLSADWKFDHPNGSPDSIALVNWQTNNNVYLLNRGQGFLPDSTFYLFQFITSDTEKYIISYTPVSNPTNAVVKTVNKTTETYFTAFSITSNKVVDMEPVKIDWDLLFTPYQGYYKTASIYAPYFLSGVFTNSRAGVEVAEIRNPEILFENISVANINQVVFTNAQDEIGYDWKLIPSLENTIYYVDTNLKYLIKSGNLQYYKLRFVSFYNDKGEKGYPVFEYAKL